MKPVRVSILGATGSIGRSVLDVIDSDRSRFRISSVVSGRDANGLGAIARRYGASFVAVADPTAGDALSDCLAGSGIAWGAGPSAVIDAAQADADVVVAGISGAAGLRPTYAALAAGRSIALANKECLVCAGESFMREAAAFGSTVLPLDSEHNALFQALAGSRIDDVERMTITASGGPFRDWPADRLALATPQEALRHPVWSMGHKISIDSATMMNKGLELIEAHHLFGIAPHRLDVLVHPQSIVHGLVTFRDGAVTAGLAVPDMRVAVAHCLGLSSQPYAGRLASPLGHLDLAQIGSLSFERPDEARFPALRLARAAMIEGGGAPTVLNAANEVAVDRFLAGAIGFTRIPELVEDVMAAMGPQKAPASIDEALEMDGMVRRKALEHVGRDTTRKAI